MIIERNSILRGTVIAFMATTTLPLLAQDAVQAVQVEPVLHVSRDLLYALVALALTQVIFIASLASIMRTMGGPGGWITKLLSDRNKAAILLPFLLLTASTVNAQAFKGTDADISSYHTFWILTIINAFLFIILLVQLNLVRRLTRVVSGSEEKEAALETARALEPSWWDKLMKSLTKQVEIEKEKDILLDHDYDGIRELDNVLPPWWLWLFYGCIAWAVFYLAAVHVLDILPEQTTEYNDAMAQAEIDIAAYKATQTSTVDETTVEMSTEAGFLAGGKENFTTFCTPCHGADAAGSENSVGPNLTDGYWLHGGGVKNVFKTIKYGVPEKGMISWKSQLQPKEISELSSYIMSLQGTGPATQKAPQGELWQEDGAVPTDSTAITADTTSVAVTQ
ncbi:MAG TPA: cbb3-type cytochrome c oxidase N-terminal domain-containing protein [Flavobacteriales bacterium]|nr:cbb3-type cytochrome c oxidase N-terminal domain-containing protein [Flavobacteriales bacterium]